MRLRLSGTTAVLAVGITLAVLVACVAGAYLYSLHHFRTLMAATSETALAQGELIRVALEHQMIENDRSLIEKMVSSFGAQAGVESVLILDRKGEARYSSAPLPAASDLAIESPTCQACHRFPPEGRMASRVIETRGGTMLRTVVPIRNREPCYSCHASNQKINGILIVDIDAARIRATMQRDLRWMVAGSGLLALLLVAAIGGVFRLAVMRRLQRFETAARQIAAGHLDRRVPTGGEDTIGWLAREFNSMADSMTGLVGEVRDERERLERVINSIDDGIVVLDVERRVIAANDAFLRRTGRVRGEVLGCTCHDATAGLCGPQDCPTQACLHTGESQVRICERRTAEGGSVWEEVQSSPILGPSGRIAQVVEVWRDISSRRESEAKLAESHRLASLGMLASGFSHEMNTPLATILACVEGILRSTGPEKAGASEERERIAASARIAREQLLRCRGITQHFLRLSSGKGSSTEVVDLEATLAAVARLIGPTAAAHAVTVEVDPGPADLRVRANEADLQHVLLNLLLNAVEACGSHGKVRLGAIAGDPVILSVADDGCGIAPQDQQRIFEPFFSLRKGGTGLGLFLSLNFVRRWGGDIRVKSVPGEGSTFEVRIPPAARSASGLEARA